VRSEAKKEIIMENNWDILKKELAFNSINLINTKECISHQDKKQIKLPINYKIVLLRKDIFNNLKVIDNLWKEVNELLCSVNSQCILTEVLDKSSISLFTNSLKELYELSKFLIEDSKHFLSTIGQRDGVYSSISFLVNLDYKSFQKHIVDCIPDYKIAMDWLLRKDSKLVYLIKLLKFAKQGSDFVCHYKTARGISGPWANLDLPLLERQFKWDDIEEEVRGRDRDIKRQRRYRMGLENQSPHDFAEGFMWRELRNEPYSWSNRGTDSPYPSRSILGR